MKNSKLYALLFVSFAVTSFATAADGKKRISRELQDQMKDCMKTKNDKKACMDEVHTKCLTELKPEQCDKLARYLGRSDAP